jgi:hypothetical protein
MKILRKTKKKTKKPEPPPHPHGTHFPILFSFVHIQKKFRYHFAVGNNCKAPKEG